MEGDPIEILIRHFYIYCMSIILVVMVARFPFRLHFKITVLDELI